MRDLKQNLSIGIIQSDLHWEEPDANLAMMEEKLWQAPKGLDLIVLPEMFTTGFSMNSERLAEPVNFRAYRWMKQMAQQLQCTLCGSVIIKDKTSYYNRLLWASPDGTIEHYDKKHLFRMAKEDEHFSAGKDRLLVSLKGWNIMPLICYDLRFPVWCRNYPPLAYDLVIFVANWPKARVRAWDSLLEARAIENLSYCLGVNRLGEDGNGVAYNGHSALYNPKGECLLSAEEKEGFFTFELSAEELMRFREKFPAHLDADAFEWIEKP